MTAHLPSWEPPKMSPAYPIILTNGRKDCFEQMAQSLSLVLDLGQGLIVDDSGNPEYAEWLRSRMPGWGVRTTPGYPDGYAGAMQEVWRYAARYEHVFLIEDDFVFQRPMFTEGLVELLDTHPHIAQFILLRQPWFGNEIASGGLLEAMVDRGEVLDYKPEWVEQRVTWSSNPTVFRGANWVLAHPWPSGEGSEFRFGQRLFTDEPGTVSAYYGDGKTPWVRHVGERSGFGY